MTTYTPRVWTVKESTRHPGYYGVSENDGPPSGPISKDRSSIERFVAMMNGDEERELALGLDPRLPNNSCPTLTPRRPPRG